MSDDGKLIKETMTMFERILPGPIDRVWEYLTADEHLGKWLLPGTIEPRAGGKVNLGNGHIRGIVTQWKPPSLLAYTWNVFGPQDENSPYPESYLRIELRAVDKHVLLTLSHRPILEGFEGLTRMGWHTFLDMLWAILHGQNTEPRDVIMERNRARYGVEKMPK